MEKDNIEESSNSVRKFWEKHGVQKPFRFIAYCLSLLPIPIISQAAQATERHLSDKELRSELDDLWGKLEAANPAVTEATSVEASIAEISQVLKRDSGLTLQAEAFFQKYLQGQVSEFSVLTEGGSFQSFSDVIVSTDIAQFEATGNSQNVIRDTNVTAHKHRIIASEGSTNTVNRSSFKDHGTSSVDMNRTEVRGRVDVEASGFRLYAGSTMRLSAPTNKVNARCPYCDTVFHGDLREIRHLRSITCSGCSRSLGLDFSGL